MALTARTRARKKSKIDIAHRAGIHGIPSIWLIGPDGKVVDKQMRGEQTVQAMEAALIR